MQDALNIDIKPGDIILSRYWGGKWWQKLFSKAITLGKGGKSHAMIFGDTMRLISAEGGGAKYVSLGRYLGKDYSITIVRDPVLKAPTRLRIGNRAERLIGTKYSYLAIVAHGIDTILTIGGRVTPLGDRPFASKFNRIDDEMVCSELVARACWEAAGISFRKYRRNTTVDWWACRPRDIEFTAEMERWVIVHRTERGKQL